MKVSPPERSRRTALELQAWVTNHAGWWGVAYGRPCRVVGYNLEHVVVIVEPMTSAPITGLHPYNLTGTWDLINGKDVLVTQRSSKASTLQYCWPVSEITALESP